MADDFALLPEDDGTSTPEEDLAASIVGALDSASTEIVPIPDPPVQPFGRSWQFDFATGRFLRAGGAPADTHGEGALAQWCLMAIHTARYQHPVFSDEFGMEEPDSPIGEFAAGEVIADWQRHITDALLVHDRISSVENFDLSWDPVAGVLTVNALDIVTDDEQQLTLESVELGAGA